jgi:hypothetical protein
MVYENMSNRKDKNMKQTVLCEKRITDYAACPKNAADFLVA